MNDISPADVAAQANVNLPEDSTLAQDILTEVDSRLALLISHDNVTRDELKDEETRDDVEGLLEIEVEFEDLDLVWYLFRYNHEDAQYKSTEFFTPDDHANAVRTGLPVNSSSPQSICSRKASDEHCHR